MNTLDATFTRKSTRAFKPIQISEDELDTVIRAGCAAPVGMGRYDSLHITVVQNGELLTEIFKEAEDSLFNTMGFRKNMDYGAKTLIVVSSAPAYREGMDAVNVGIVIENMVIAATSLGIDSVILGGPIAAISENGDLKRDMSIPQGFTPMLAVSLGYAVEDEPAKKHSISVNRV